MHTLQINTFNTSSPIKPSEERLTLAMRGTNDGLWDWNLLTNEVYFSPRWKSMLGYEDLELYNHFDTWKKLVHPDDKNRILKEVKDCIANYKEDFEVEMRMKHKNGTDIIVLSRAFFVGRETDGKPIRLVGTHVDITEAKKSEEFIRKTNSILEMIAVEKSASEVYDKIALMYESRHPGMRCSLLELGDGKLLHGGAPSMPKEYCQAVHGLEVGPEVGSCGASTYCGERVLVENIETDPKWAKIKKYALPHGMRSCWSEPIINSKGKVLGAFGMYYDYPSLPNTEESDDLHSAARLASIVMERDQLQKESKKNQKLIEEQSKLASMGEMIANIAHQWRQPLSSISSSATSAILLNEVNALNNNDLNKIMDNINQSAQYLSKTIEDFRGFFDPQNNKVKITSTSKIVEKTLVLLYSKLREENVHIIKNIEDISLQTLENELIQVLLNLLNNSTDAFKKLKNQNKLIFLTIYKKKNSIYIELKDNAGGINEDILHRIFEPYFTTKHKSQGTGIGLFMSQTIIREHLKGDIKIENTIYEYNDIKYKGVNFIINIPIIDS